MRAELARERGVSLGYVWNWPPRHVRVFVPEKYDGWGAACLELCQVVEELSHMQRIAVTYAPSPWAA